MPQVQWYRDWLARAQVSEAGRATLWLLLGAVALIAGTLVSAYVDYSMAAPSPLPGYRWLDWVGSDPLQFLGLALLVGGFVLIKYIV